MSVQFIRNGGGQDVWRQFTSWGYGEFDFADFVSNSTEISATRAADASGIITPLVQQPSVWEFAGQLVAGGADQSTANFFGGGHGNVSRTGKTITVDGVDVTNSLVGFTASGALIVMDQVYNVLLPANNAIITGIYELTHSLSSAGLRVDKTVTFATPPQFEWFSVYAAMFPLEGFNRLQLGSGPVETILSPVVPNTRDGGSQVTTIQASSTNHPYFMTLTLPTGFPDSSENWADGAPDNVFWIDQQPAKLYVCAISTEFPRRKTAFTWSSSAIYQISTSGTIWTPESPSVEKAVRGFDSASFDVPPSFDSGSSGIWTKLS